LLLIKFEGKKQLSELEDEGRKNECAIKASDEESQQKRIAEKKTERNVVTCDLNVSQTLF
jgi:hypothetical protein